MFSSCMFSFKKSGRRRETFVSCNISRNRVSECDRLLFNANKAVLFLSKIFRFKKNIFVLFLKRQSKLILNYNLHAINIKYIWQTEKYIFDWELVLILISLFLF